MTDATQVTGSPTAGPGVSRPGDVLAERYELLELIDPDGVAISFRALDQESERQVLVRVLAGPGLHTDVCDQVVKRLSGLVGVGGRCLASLLDADREKRSPFTVEKWPRGTQLSSILDSRRSRGEALGPQEALPVVAQLAAALAALPEGLHHGDVRAEHVWLDTDGLRLTGAFLLSVLPSDELADRVRALGPGAVAYAPELEHGIAGRASDVWGVGAIAWEALTGRSPDPNAATPEIEGSLRDALVELLDEAPDRRPPDLARLLRSIAKNAGLAVPNLDPEPHHPPTATVDERGEPRGDRTQPSAAVRLAAREIEGAAPEGTQEISFEDIIEEAPDDDSLDPRLVRAALGVSMESDSGPDDTAKHSAIIDVDSDQDIGESLDPRLVRAALGVELDSSGDEAAEPSEDALDPRLVRAALGVELDSSEDESGEATVDLEEDALPLPRPPGRPRLGKSAGSPAPVPSARPRPPPPRPKPKPPAPEPKSDPPARPRPVRAPMPKAPAPPGPRPSAPDREPRAGTPAPEARPSAPGPRPRASAPAAPPPKQRPSAPGPRISPAPAPKPKARLSPEPQPARRLEPRPPPRSVDVAGLDVGLEEGTTVLGRKRESTATARAWRGRTTGVIIVVIALLLAVGIVGLGFLIAGERRSDATRQRQIDERLEQLRHQ